MGIKLSDADIFQMMHDADEDNSGAIGLYCFLIFDFLPDGFIEGFMHDKTKTKTKKQKKDELATCHISLEESN